MSKNRHKNRDWSDAPNTYEKADLRVLMDIRDELQALNRVMQCPHVGAGFRAFAKIALRDEWAFKRRVANAVAKRIKRKS